jgi:hypothetical protein
MARSCCDEAIQLHPQQSWIASRSLSSGAHSRDPVARKDGSIDYLCGGVSTTNATIRRTTGSTAIKVGNATSHDMAHAAGQVETNARVGPRLIIVETPDMTKVINRDRTSGIMIAA